MEPAPAVPGMHVRVDRHGVVVEDAATGDYLRCDAAARWVAWTHGGVAWRRALDGRVHVRGPGVDEALADDEAARVHDAVAREAARVADRLAAPEAAPVAPHALALVREAARHDGAWFAAEEASARALYPEGIPILPPHRYRDVVVVPARGCPNGDCSFCAFYRDRRFVVLGADDFDAHLAALVAHVGRALDAYDGVFLGSGSAASIPDATLLARLGRVRAALGPRRRQVATFLDPDHAPRRTPARWARLAEAGLVDVTVGLETGLAALRASVHKSGDVDGFVAAVAAAKAGGLRVAVTVLLGLGGAGQALPHRDATVAALGRMPLDARDLVYLSPLAGSMPPDALEGEAAAWRAGLAAVTPARASHYPAEGFVART